ncbi:Trihelix transcription factor PTL [Acorus calamus]|uniref:Trihelix transcription factor PTL n=1 Tax=Acorus calamus TaxID=4465 RepID=A0AAV9EBJ8_ACOCL|nr:Trihelix transcription factor PTL [Acorus calamus]
MAEEHGYQRSGRKCREKLENLYKYYKKTKKGKAAGRQDGKHYRCLSSSSKAESPSLSNHSYDDFLETSSSDKEDDRQRNGWRSKMMREFVDSQMRRFIEVQEAFLDKMLKTLENKVQERMLKEEVWRREETTRLKREHKLWAIEASLGGSSQRGSNAGFVKNHRG